MLAKPEGYVRIFVDEGPPMAELLTRMKDEGGRMKEYIHKLLAAFGKQKDVYPFDSAQDRPSSLSPQPLVEPLSKREFEVLRLLATELNGPEIARELMVSLNTMRTHTKNIYSKLGVHNRREAVRRAEELDLL
jgi:LuxR family maltose regulon positive regulatory protein